MTSKIRKVTAEEIKNYVDPPEEVRALRKQLQSARLRLNQYKREQGSLFSLVRDIGDSVVSLAPPKLVYPKPSKQKVKKPVALCVHNTDWHMGAQQDSDEIEGFNEFSPRLLSNRIISPRYGLVPHLLTWTELHRSAYVVDECRVLVTGDLVSGDIHEELRVTNAYPVPVQVVKAGELLASEISLLSPHFEKVIVDFVLADNHGRLTKRPQHKEAGFNSFNYPLAYIAKKMLLNHKNVVFNIYPKEQQVVSVKGRKYLICHGHQVRGWAGFPYYGLQRKVGKEAMKRMRKNLGKFDRIVLGHYHAPLQHPHYWIGGSASGTDAYDHSEGREADPVQSAWFVHPKHGEFDRTDWLLRDG